MIQMQKISIHNVVKYFLKCIYIDVSIKHIRTRKKTERSFGNANYKYEYFNINYDKLRKRKKKLKL